jgi:hypothetical protein
MSSEAQNVLDGQDTEVSEAPSSAGAGADQARGAAEASPGTAIPRTISPGSRRVQREGMRQAEAMSL